MLPNIVDMDFNMHITIELKFWEFSVKEIYHRPHVMNVKRVIIIFRAFVILRAIKKKSIQNCGVILTCPKCNGLCMAWNPSLESPARYILKSKSIEWCPQTSSTWFVKLDYYFLVSKANKINFNLSFLGAES